MHFAKYHALGNDYIVVDGGEWSNHLTEQNAQRLCHRHFGVGSDGVLVKVPEPDGRFRLRILNPDGSEAEKSGNGLRIFARYLWDMKLVREEPFTVSTLGGDVLCHVSQQGRLVQVEMGKVSFNSKVIPINGPDREVIQEQLEVGGRTFIFTAATIGNPHCVILVDEINRQDVLHFGPLLETHQNFPRRTNVQFLRVVDRSTIQIEIWERGAGYTLASGSSSSASAAVAHRLGLVDRDVTVRMPGGNLQIVISDDFHIQMTGSVTAVSTGTVSSECFALSPWSTHW